MIYVTRSMVRASVYVVDMITRDGMVTNKQMVTNWRKVVKFMGISA